MRRHISILPALLILVAGLAAGALAQGSRDCPAANDSFGLGPCPEASMMLAQAIDGQGPRHGGPGMHGMRHDNQQRKYLDQLRTLKMLEVLDLKGDQETKFLSLFNKMRQTNDDLRDQKQQLMDQLTQAVNDSSSNQQINELTDQIIKLERERRESDLKFMEDSRKILTPMQVGRLIIFHERFEYEMLERLRMFRNRGGQQPGEPPMNPDDTPR